MWRFVTNKHVADKSHENEKSDKNECDRFSVVPEVGTSLKRGVCAKGHTALVLSARGSGGRQKLGSQTHVPT